MTQAWVWRSQFAFAADADTWSIPGDFNSYEHLYRKMRLSELRDANTPLTLKFSDDLYAAVHEAALVDFPEMVLRHEDGLSFRSALAPLKQVRRGRRGPAAASSPAPTVASSPAPTGDLVAVGPRHFPDPLANGPDRP